MSSLEKKTRPELALITIFGQTLTEYMDREDIKPSELSKLVGCSTNAVWFWRRGAMMPSKDNYNKLCSVLGASFEMELYSNFADFFFIASNRGVR